MTLVYYDKMHTFLFGLSLSALFSVTSLLVVLFRASPLLSPAPAITAFFVSLFLSLATVTTLLLVAFWHSMKFHAWDTGKLLSISLRQGTFFATGTTIVTLFHRLDLLTWWIAVFIYGVFLLIELALEH